MLNDERGNLVEMLKWVCILHTLIQCVDNFAQDHLFKWVEEAVFEEVEDNLPKLGLIENELFNVKTEVEEMKALTESLKNDVERGKLIHKIWCVSICLIVIVIVIVWIGKTKEKLLMVGY